MRFRVTNEGYITIDTYDSGEVLSNTEIGSPLYTHYTGSYLSPNSDHWYCIEQYVKFSTDPSQAIHRVWIDGVLVDEVLNHATLNSSTDVCNSVYFFTYWNMRVAQSQYAYIDDLVITTDRPASKDRCCPIRRYYHCIEYLRLQAFVRGRESPAWRKYPVC